MYNISNEIREKMREVLADNNISNEEKKHIIVDIFANLFGAEPSTPSFDNSDDDTLEYDPEYAAGYNLGKWFASETYKNYGHEPNTENMIDIPKRERMKILESAGQKLPKDQRLFDIIGNGLTLDEKIQLIIDLFMEPDENSKPSQGQQGQGQNQQSQQQNQQQQNQQQQQSQQQGQSQNQQQSQQGQSGEQSQESGEGDSDSSSQDDSNGQGNDTQNGSGSSNSEQGHDSENQQSGGGSNSNGGQDNKESGEESGSSGNGEENGSDDEFDENGSGSSKSEDGDDSENQGDIGRGSDDADSEENGSDADSSGKSAQEELDDLLNSDKGTEDNSSNNDYDFGDDVFGNDHVISQDDGEKIRNSENAKISDTDKQFGEDGDTSIEMLDELYDQIQGKLTAEDKEIVQKINNDLKQKVQRAKKGIVNWKKLLRKFMNTYADEYEKGGLRKNLYKMSGIGLYHPKPKKQLKKCVVYIDTSGSVNNEQTQLVPLMLAEIGKIAKDCGFSTVDVNLFHHTVYTDVDDPTIIARTKNIKPSTTVKKDWGILAQDGGTDIQQVYKSIEKNYTHNGKLNPGVATIIIITDVEGIMDSGTVSNFNKKFDRNVFKRMVYVIYDRYKDVHKGMLTTKVDEVLSPYSSHIEIGLKDFKKQIKARFTNESNNNDTIYMKKKYLREASLADRRKARDEQRVIAQSGDAEKISDVLRKDAIAGGRLLGVGANDRYFRPIKDIVERISLLGAKVMMLMFFQEVICIILPMI